MQYFKEISQGKRSKTVLSDIYHKNMGATAFGSSEYINEIEKYIDNTPFAQYALTSYYYVSYHIEKNKSDKQAYLDAASKLKYAGGYYFAMALGTKIELEEYGKTDNEIFCEAYYNGCDLYSLKQKYGIKCSD